MPGEFKTTDIPKRISLTSQVFAYIRKRMETGEWQDYLPSERSLCDMLQVSRPTIRTALHQLGKEGLLDIKRGRRSRLSKASKPPRNFKTRVVGLISHEPISTMPPVSLRGISRMREYLVEQGFSTVSLVCQHHSAPAKLRSIETFLRQNNVLCCVLVSVNKEIQQWFARHAIPSLVLGSCHPSVNLPSFDVDYRSVCRHAAGVLLRKKHTHIALVLPNSGIAGELASEQGFHEAFKPHHGAGELNPVVVRHTGTARNITTRLDALFNSDRPPSALIVAKPWHVFAVIIYLLKHGLSVPEKVSLIARDQDLRFSFVEPAIAHYQFKSDMFERRLSRFIVKLISQGGLSREPQLIFPDYFEGGTVSLPPA